MDTQKTYTIHIQGERAGEGCLSLSGRIEVGNLHLFVSETDALIDQMTPRKLLVNLSNLEYLDSAGALGLLQLEDRARSIPFQFDHVSERAKKIMGLVNRKALTMKPLVSEKKSNVIEQIGDGSLKIFNDFVSIITFLGDLLTALIHSFRQPRSVRWGDFLFYLKRAGVDGLPIVGLLSFLLGLIIAFMSSLQLKQFGANIYVASFVGVALVSELGPIMTAVIVAGRSGSAFAAEIGTMKVNEEVDALVVMGFDPTHFLAVPKVLAAMVAVPILTLYSDFFGIGGGLVVEIGRASC